MEIVALKHELESVHKLLDMLVVLVDPEDVKAALELKQTTPENSALLELADECDMRPDLLDEYDERPW